MPRIILPKTTTEQRLPLYEDVESLVTVGFLSHSVIVNGTHLMLRSLGPGDLFLLRSRIASPKIRWEAWAVASAIWMVDGNPILGQQHLTRELAQLFRHHPHKTTDVLFSLVMGLFARQSRAMDAVESYCYESVSRFRWRSYGGHSTPSHTGIPGSETLGTNYVQRMWTFFNELEDRRLREESFWEGIKLAVSAQSPTGVKKIDQHDKQRWQSEQERRQAIHDRFYYVTKGIITPEQISRGQDKDLLQIQSKSADQLAEEMRRWVAGEEDWHDKAVNEYKAKIIAAHEADLKEREERAAMLRERLAQETEAQGESPPTILVGYTPEQLAEILSERSPGGRFIPTPRNTQRDYLYDKFVSKRLDPGALESRDGSLRVKPGAGLAPQVIEQLVSTDADDEE